MEGPPEDQGLSGPGHHKQKLDDRNKVPSGDLGPGMPGPARFRQSPELRSIPLQEIEFLNLGGEYGNISDLEKASLTTILKSDTGPPPGSRPNKRPFLWQTPPAPKPDQVEGPGLDFGVSEVFNSLNISAPEFPGPQLPPNPVPHFVQGIPVPGGAKHIHINNFTANINYHAPTDAYHAPSDTARPDSSGPASLPAQPGLPLPFTASAVGYPGAYVAPFPQATPPGHYSGPNPYPSMMMYNSVPAVTFSMSPYFPNPNGQMSPSPTHPEQGNQQPQAQQKEVRPKQHESITFGNSCPVVSVLQKDTSSDEEVGEDEMNKMRYREGTQPPRHIVERDQGPRQSQPPFSKDANKTPAQVLSNQPQSQMTAQNIKPAVIPHPPILQQTPPNIVPSIQQFPNPSPAQPIPYSSINQTPPNNPQMYCMSPPVAVPVYPPQNFPTSTLPAPKPALPPQQEIYTPQAPKTENAVKRSQPEIYSPQPPKTENAVKRSQPTQQEAYIPQAPKTENAVKRSQPEANIPQAPKTEIAVKRSQPPQPETYIPQAPRTENAVKRTQPPQPETYIPQAPRTENAVKRTQPPQPETYIPQAPRTENAVKRSQPEPYIPQAPRTENAVKRSPAQDPAPKSAVPPTSPKPEQTPSKPAPEEEGSGPKSWASLFSSNSSPGGPANLLPVDKPTARIPPFSAQNSDAERSEAGGNSGPTSQERELGIFLRSYKLNHMAPSFLPRGLTNRSNWCFVNAILQSLQACPPFYNLLKALPLTPMGLKQRKSSTPIIDSVVEFVSEFSTLEVMNKIEKKDKSRKKQDLSVGNPFEASYVYRMLLNLESETFKVVEGRQEDAEEFLTCLLNGLSDEMLGLLKLTEEPAAENQPEAASQQPPQQEGGAEWHEVGAKGRGSCVTRRVVEGGGQYETSIMQLALGLCRSCVKSDGGETSATLQPFYTLQLDIQHNNVTTVTEALAANFSSEQLDGYICSKTKQEVEASRSVSLEELPPILILHLKRFVYDSATGGVQKVMKNVEFMVDLEIDKTILSSSTRTKFTLKQRQYKLFAVVYHNGREATKGHYVADVYHTGYATWLHCDDSTVKPTAEGLVTTPAPNSVPYILFYRRCDTMVGVDKTHK